MPLSFRSRLAKLEHKGQISQEEYQSLITKLDGHDKQIRADVIDEFRMALHTKYADNKYLYESNPEYWNLDMEEVDEISNQLKGAENGHM